MSDSEFSEISYDELLLAKQLLKEAKSIERAKRALDALQTLQLILSGLPDTVLRQLKKLVHEAGGADKAFYSAADPIRLPQDWEIPVSAKHGLDQLRQDHGNFRVMAALAKMALRTESSGDDTSGGCQIPTTSSGGDTSGGDPIP